MTHVFQLTHERPLPQGGNGCILIGFFATKEDAQEAIQKSILLPGFCDHQEDFIIREIEIDKDLI